MNPAKSKPIKERPPDLNQRQKAFIREYCICMNIEEAQKKVGYKQHHGNGRRILDDPRSAAELKRNQRKAAELANVHLAWVLSNIEKIAGVNFHDVRKFDEHGNFVGLDLQKMTREQTFAISEIGFDSEGRAKIK